jgi:hypothetical protein
VYDQVPALNDACREAFGSILDKYDWQKQEIASLKTQLSGVASQLSSVLLLLRDNGGHGPLQPVEGQQPQQAEEDNGGDIGGDIAGKLLLIVVCFFDRASSDRCLLLLAGDEEDAADDAPEDGGPPPAPPQERALTVNDLGQGEMPDFPTRIPKTFVQFLAIWESKRLSRFLTDRMISPGWQGMAGRRRRDAWAKRKYIYRKICAKAQELMVSLPDAARHLDQARQGETLGNWYKRTHAADLDIAKRNRLGLDPPPPRQQEEDDDDEELIRRPVGVRAPPPPPQAPRVPHAVWAPTNAVVRARTAAATVRRTGRPGRGGRGRSPGRGRGRSGRGRGRAAGRGHATRPSAPPAPVTPPPPRPPARFPPPRPLPPSVATNRQFRAVADERSTERLRRAQQEIVREHGVHDNSVLALEDSLVARLEATREAHNRSRTTTPREDV